MKRDDNSGTFSLLWQLALKTLWYSVVFGALVLVLVCVMFPAAAEDFYFQAGNAALSFQFAEKATPDDADVFRLRKTADKAIALMETDASYAGKAQRYCLKLLESDGAAQQLAEYDGMNVAQAPREWHVNLCDSVDYYSTALYRARLAEGDTRLYVGGKDVAIGDVDGLLGTNFAASTDAVYLINQLSVYAAEAGEQQQDALLTARFTEFYKAALKNVLGALDADSPALKDLFALKAFYRFYNVMGGDGEWGAVDGDFPDDIADIKDLYEYCFENYCNTNETEVYDE